MPQGGQGLSLTRLHVVSDDALGDLDAVGVAAAIAAGSISSREATEAAIARIEAAGELNAVQVADYERALEQSDSPVAGVLSGVPSMVKDNCDVTGLTTHHGSLAVHTGPAPADDPFVQQLRSTGLGVLGKTTMPEFGWNASTEYESMQPTRNPWNTGHTAGGSSGGAAALVAAGALPIAHGNDGGGSIRIPAAACGLVGLKPTRGRVVPGAQSAALPVDVISNGVLTRTVRDTAHFLHGTQLHTSAPDLPRLDLVEGASDRRLRIGVVLDSVVGRTDDDCRRVVTETVDLLESLGHTVVEVPLPVDEKFAAAFQHYWALLAFSVQKFGRRTLHDPDFDGSRTDGLTQGLARRYARSIWRTPFTLRTLKQSERQYARTFSDAQVDLVLSPTLGYVTPALGHLDPSVEFDTLFDRLTRFAAFTPLNNATGSPAISLPLGTSTDDLPVGVHFSATRGDERTLLELAYELEEARPFATVWG